MIRVENLRYAYSAQEGDVLKGLDFEIKKGEIFGFLGPSGAGKSTTQKLIIGGLKRYRGSIKVEGKELSECGRNYFEKIGVGFEFPNFYSKFTALENLEFFGKLYKKMLDPMELLAKVGLEKDADKRVGEYSKGMKMRLNYCRAVLNDPDIIFLDEPTSGLDPVNAKKMRALIQEEKKRGKTILLTTHNMLTAEKLCDRIAFIIDGEIKVVDTVRNLKLKAGEKTVAVEYREEGKLVWEEYNLTNLGANKKFLKVLSKKIETIHSKEATLEDVFVKVTGRNLV